MNEDQRNGESGEKPEQYPLPPCRSPFTKGQGNEELSQGAVCISSSKDSRGMGRMRDGKTFSHSDLAVPFL